MISIPGPALLSVSEVHIWRIAMRDARVLLRTICRRHLRTLLARYTGIAPEEIRLTRGARGKLSLAPSLQREGIEFNVSHSEGVALIVLARDRPVGIDVERISAARNVDLIARRWFSREEDEGIRRLPAETRREAFYRCWTRKEAVIKAIGGSLAELTTTVVVSTEARVPARILRMPPVAGAPEWQLEDVTVGEGYAAALCYGGVRATVRLWELPP
jgi:4'-phosphopantetheinyl transferase